MKGAVIVGVEVVGVVDLGDVAPPVDPPVVESADDKDGDEDVVVPAAASGASIGEAESAKPVTNATVAATADAPKNRRVRAAT